MSETVLQCWLDDNARGSLLTGLVDRLSALVPAPATFEDDRWNIITWKLRPGNSRALYLHFDKLSHPDLRTACKLWILHGRHARQIGHGAATGRLRALRGLCAVLGARPLQSLNNMDFLEAQRLLQDTNAISGAYGLAKGLEAFATWLNLRTGLRLSYTSGIKKTYSHGRRAHDSSRRKKLLPDEVIRDLVACNRREDISANDRFYLQIFVLNIGAGFRVGELAHLPADCLLEENGALQLIYIPEKSGKTVPKVVPPSLAPAVRKAVETLQQATADLRGQARELRDRGPPDWRKISDDEEAAKYFVAKLAHDWTSDPKNRLITADGMWHWHKRRYIDAIGELERCGGNKSEVRRQLGISGDSLERLLRDQQAARDGQVSNFLASDGTPRARFMADARAINGTRIKEITRTTIWNRYSSVRAIIKEAQSYQVRSEAFPAPAHDHMLEQRFRRKFALVRDRNGATVLEAHEALLLKKRRGSSDDFLAITAGDLAKWLFRRDRGNVFERLGILDPNTGSIAKFTWHDVRHWLDTQYERGGLTQQQIALIFGRKDVGQNATYDQTSTGERAHRLQQAVRDGQIAGLIPDTYARLADISRDQAEEYLGAAMRMVNIMPHGLCTLNWAMSPCPHFLSCFACGDDESHQGPCEHLLIDGDDSLQVAEVERLRSEAKQALTVIPPESPMFDRYLRVFTNTTLKLERLGVGVSK